MEEKKMNGRFIKRTICASLGALMMLQGAATAAEVSSEVTVFERPQVTSIECAQVGKNYVYVTLETTNADNDEPIIVYLRDEADNLKTLAYGNVSGDAAEIKLGVPDDVNTGTYYVYAALNLAGELAAGEVFYVGVGDVDGFIDTINLTDTDADTVEDKLDEYYEALSVVQYTADSNGNKVTLSGDNYEAFTTGQKAEFASQIASGVSGKYEDTKGSFTAENAESFIKESYLLAIYNAEDSTDSEIATALYTFGVATAELENTTMVATIAKTMSSEVTSSEELTETVTKAVAVETVNEGYWANLVSVVKANNDVFGVDEDEIAELEDSKTMRNKFCTAFKGTYLSVEAVVEAWDSAYATALKSTSSSGGSGGGSSSGSSSSSSSSSSGTVTTYGEGVYIADNTDMTGTKKVITDYYSDVNTTSYSWASDAILALTNAGIVSGYGDGTFGPEKSLTRAEFMKMLVNACGLADVTATCSFTDVEAGSWYYVYIASAEKLGLATGYGDGTFGVNDPITREDMLTLIYRAAQTKGISLKSLTTQTLTFEDKSDISDYAVEAVKALYYAGVYLDTSNPYGTTKLEPKSKATRAYAAMILYSVYKLK
ncbi:MAG: S-layer homology domain-containing protein [Clostridia bacterium]|nr:S-layer homology domain-containing protein [Clostridia bacterium]